MPTSVSFGVQGHCKDIIGEHWDIVIRAFAQNCPGLKSLDLWRARTLTDGAILEIAQNCPLLESLDIGWCRVDCPACIPIVAVKCPKLRKLFMTAIRGVDDSCLVALAKHSRELEQLDMLGSSLVTVEVIESIIRVRATVKSMPASSPCARSFYSADMTMP